MKTETKSDNGAMKTHHFLLKEDGNLYVISEMPEKPWTTDYPFKGFPKYAPDHSEIDAYEQALSRAKESAILVENKEEVITYEYHRCLEDGPDPGGGKSVNEESVFQVGQLYPLECQVEVRTTTDCEMPHRSMCYASCTCSVKQVALITFSEVKDSVRVEEIGIIDLSKCNHGVIVTTPKPSEEQGERQSSPAHTDNQEELWNEVSQWFGIETYAASSIRELQNRFTITRKQKVVPYGRK